LAKITAAMARGSAAWRVSSRSQS